MWSQRQNASESVISPFSRSTSPAPTHLPLQRPPLQGRHPLCSVLLPPPSTTAPVCRAHGGARAQAAAPLLPHGPGLLCPSAEPGSVCTWARTPFSQPQLEACRLPRGPGCLPAVLLLSGCVCVCTLMHTCILLMTSPKGDRQGEESWVIQHPFPASDHPKQLVSSLAGSALLG